MDGRALLRCGHPRSCASRTCPSRVGALRHSHVSSNRWRTVARALAEAPASSCVDRARRDQFIRNGDTESSYVQLQVRFRGCCFPIPHAVFLHVRTTSFICVRLRVDCLVVISGWLRCGVAQRCTVIANRCSLPARLTPVREQNL